MVRKKRILRKRVYVLGISLILILLAFNFSNVIIGLSKIIDKDVYTEQFLEKCTTEEIQSAEVKGIDGAKQDGIWKEGELISPKTDDDRKILHLISMLNHEKILNSHIPMKYRELKSNDDEIIKKVKKLKGKIPGRDLELQMIEGKKVFVLKIEEKQDK